MDGEPEPAPGAIGGGSQSSGGGGTMDFERMFAEVQSFKSSSDGMSREARCVYSRRLTRAFARMGRGAQLAP